MTTKSGGTEKPPTDTHLIADNDPRGHAKTWCGAEFVPGTESLAETTCLLCLKAAKVYGEGAARRLQQLEASKANPRKGRKRRIDRDSGADGHNGVWGT